MTEHPDSSAEVEAPEAGHPTTDQTVPDDNTPDESGPDQSGPDESASADAPVADDDTPFQSTGHPAVDEVLRSLDALDGRPVDEHVGVFEKAHEDLRRALSDAGEASGDAPSPH